MTRPGAILTERDVALLRSLATLRFLTSSQVQRLYFPSEATALRRLRRLDDAGLIRRIAAPTIPARLVMLTARGLEAAMDGSAEESHSRRARPPKPPRPLFLRHLVAVNDFRVSLIASLRHSRDVALLGFVTDSDRRFERNDRRPHSCLAASVDIPGEAPIRHAPDAAFVLQRGDRRALFFLEVDLATEVIGQPRRGVGRLVRFYLHALAQGRAQSLAPTLADVRNPEAVRVLVLTPARRRLENIRRVWGSRPFVSESAKRRMWLAGFERLHSGDLLTLPWLSLDPNDEEHYFIASPSEET